MDGNSKTKTKHTPPPKQKPKLDGGKASPVCAVKVRSLNSYEDEGDSDFEENGFDRIFPLTPSSPSSLLSSPLGSENDSDESGSECTGFVPASIPPEGADRKGSPVAEKPPETPLDKERALVESLFVEGSYKYRTRIDYYPIEKSWWDRWACYANYLGAAQKAPFEQRLLSADPPGPINNLGLTELNTSLVDAYKSFGELIGDTKSFDAEVLGEFPPSMSAKCGYVCVPAEVWALLQGAYGGGPEVRVQHAGPIISECCKFELLELVVVHSKFPAKIFPVECYNYWTAGYLKSLLATIFRASEDDARLVDLSCRAQRTVLRDDRTLVLNKIVSADCVCFEVKDRATGKWPDSPGAKEDKQSADEQKETEEIKTCNGERSAETPGLCGLVNMGNTCYMNCVLQALFHTEPLTQYLTGTDWRHDARIHGPWKIAEEYCALLGELVSRRSAAVEPRAFRSCVTALAPHFSGLQQQDCHEMLNVLLDGLCEDLKCTPAGAACGAPEYNGESAEAWAEAEWARHTRRRWGVVDALFSGQLLSTRECPDCGARTLSCQPFQTLELPIPSRPARRRQVVRVYLSASERLRRLGLHLTLCFAVGSACTVSELRRRTAEVLNAIGGPLGGGFDECCILVAHTAQGRTVLDADPAAPVCSHSEYVACITDAPADLAGNRLIHVRMCEARTSGPLSPVNACFLYLPADRVSYARVAVEAVRVFAGLSPQKHVEAERKLAELAVFRASAAKRRSPQSSPAGKVPPRTPPCSSEGADSEDLGAPVFGKLSNRAVAECAGSLFELQECGAWQARGRRWRPQPSSPSQAPEPSPAVVALNAVITAKWKPLCVSRPEECAQYSGDEDPAGSGSGGGGGGTSLCLDDCLAAAGRPEQLSEENRWRCPRCAAEKKAVVTLQVWRAPPVLVVDLMRFSVQSQYASSKVGTRVEFPLAGLDMSPYVKGPPPREGLCYDLYAVCNHVGSPNCGHYTASVKCDGEWYLFDDALVKRIEDPAAAVVSSEAYLLFYVRRGFELTHNSV